MLILEVMIGVTLGILLANFLQERYAPISIWLRTILPLAIKILKLIFSFSILIYTANEFTWIDQLEREYQKLRSFESYLIFYFTISFLIGIFSLIGNFAKWILGEKIKENWIDLRSFYLSAVTVCIFMAAKFIAEVILPKDAVILSTLGIFGIAAIMRAKINIKK